VAAGRTTWEEKGGKTATKGEGEKRDLMRARRNEEIANTFHKGDRLYGERRRKGIYREGVGREQAKGEAEVVLRNLGRIPGGGDRKKGGKG